MTMKSQEVIESLLKATQERIPNITNEGVKLVWQQREILLKWVLNKE